jgi:hypothetical protein
MGYEVALLSVRASQPASQPPASQPAAYFEILRIFEKEYYSNH